MKIDIKKVSSTKELEICSKLRKEVFGIEEKAPETLFIIDDKDMESTISSFILRLEGIPVASCRYIKIDDEVIKLQRMVVLKEYRKKGLAREILKYLEVDAIKSGFKKIIMDSAESAAIFYEKCGYIKKSDVFYEDGRPHIKMEKEL